MSVENQIAGQAYLFGDSDIAAERLRLLAKAFAPSTREFLGRLGVDGPRSVVDLGCGPGYTTRLIAEVLPQAVVLGLDNSPHFISLARQTPTERVKYAVADVTASLQSGPYDLIYSRYLLTHIGQSREAIAGWNKHLFKGGVIAIEENEWIHTNQPAFVRYLEIVEAMLADGGQRLYVGAELAREQSWPSLRVAQSEVVSIAARDSDAARMFVMNIATWRRQPFIERSFSRTEIEGCGGISNDSRTPTHGPAPSSSDGGGWCWRKSIRQRTCSGRPFDTIAVLRYTGHGCSCAGSGLGAA